MQLKLLKDLLLTIDVICLQANGGRASHSYCGGGGGGRVAMYWKAHEYWYGSLQAFGADKGYSVGGAGTVYILVSAGAFFSVQSSLKQGFLLSKCSWKD